MKKVSVLFVCHGNICRSPMAEYVLKNIVHKAGLDDYFLIDSVATSTEEIGNPVYSPARRILALHGITDVAHRARQFTNEDYRNFDYIFVMDNRNLKNIMKMSDNDPDGKISLLLGNEEIEDPWYTDNFEKVYNQIERGCKLILEELKNE